MTMALYILSGASRGLGRALASRLLEPDNLLLTLSRQPDETLAAEAKGAGTQLEQWAVDLAHAGEVAARLEAWLHGEDATRSAQATLINNAGIIGRVGPLDATDADTLAAVLRINLEAPLLLTAAFLRATRDWPVRRRVLNISSGAGRRPIAGWTAYCAAKAGLDHATRVLALDEVHQPNPARVCSLAPGVIDTDMQRELRAADGAGFPDQAQFVQLKQSGNLTSPGAAAERVLAFLARPDFGTEPVADVRS
jgi:NAD(P)-dependent dehydrogenase (short-subunit alcohol dehydrogenase family)